MGLDRYPPPTHGIAAQKPLAITDSDLPQLIFLVLARHSLASLRTYRTFPSGTAVPTHTRPLPPPSTGSGSSIASSASTGPIRVDSGAATALGSPQIEAQKLPIHVLLFLFISFNVGRLRDMPTSGHSDYDYFPVASLHTHTHSLSRSFFFVRSAAELAYYLSPRAPTH